MMRANVVASENHSRFIGQVYEDHYNRLRHYFQVQLGDSTEANDCVHETIRRFFLFMEEREWEAEYVHVYLMRIAGLLCTQKLAENRPRPVGNHMGRWNESLFNKVREEAIEAAKECRRFKQFLLTPKEESGKLTLMPNN